MSFRHPYITDFIYQASEETKGANRLLEDLFGEYTDHVDHMVGENGYGYFSGLTRSLSTPDQIYENIEELVYKLSKATKVPFRLTFMFESGPITTYYIEPSPK